LDALRQILLVIEGTGHRLSTPGKGSEVSTRRSCSQTTRNPHVALLIGEAGIGKTRLAEELSHEAKASGWTVAWTHAYEQEGAIPYRPWIDLLRILLQSIPAEKLLASVASKPNDTTSESIPYVPTTLERLSTLLPELHAILPSSGKNYPPLPPEQERFHLWEATLTLLTALSNIHPLLIVLDDLHWADGSSRELLAYLARHLQGQRIVLVCTCRDIEMTPNDGLRTLIADLRREQQITLVLVEPLTQAQIGSLVAHLPQRIVQHIQTQAGGNPFFAEELARVSEATQVGGFLQEASAYRALPESIAEVLERRLSRLSDACQLLLNKAAVLGGSFEFSQLRFMTNEQDEDRLLDLLEEALRAGLLTEESMGVRIIYHFWHPLIVSHLYARLSAARRAQLHRRAAHTLISAHEGHEEEAAAAITHHLNKGGEASSLIGQYAEIAGHQAYSLAAYGEAEEYYRQTIAILTDSKLAVLVEEEEVLLLPILPQGCDTLHIARLLERICECCMVQGNFEESRLLYRNILALRTQQPVCTLDVQAQKEAQIQALIWREIGRAWASTGNFEEANACYERGKQVMSDAEVTSGAAWACVHLQLGSIQFLQGNYDESRVYVLEALAMLEQVMQVEFDVQPNNAEIVRLFQTRIECAIIGDPLDLGRAHELLGLIDASVGQITEALNHLYTALAIFEKHDLVIAMVKVCGNLGAVHAMKSDDAVARIYLRRTLDLAERMGNLPSMALATGNLGEMAARAGNLPEAEEWLRRALAISDITNEREHATWCNTTLAIVLQDQGNLQGASECIRRALALGRSMKSTRCIGTALTALAAFRLTQAILSSTMESADYKQPDQRSEVSTRLLLRAKSTAQRAILLEGFSTEQVIEARLLLASIHVLLGDVEAARQEAMKTLAESAYHEITRMFARAQRILGRILAFQEEYEQADTYFEQSIQFFRKYEMRLEYARAIHGYGLTLLQRSLPGRVEYQRGLDYVQEARSLFVDCRAMLDVAWLDTMLQRLDYHMFRV
ncbi:MAG: tetratricopeptide repeat protein, partial [Chloroflexota bacterium]|nr:tetratricopeptide repeat protein [Chloroflexota bacterium]